MQKDSCKTSGSYGDALSGSTSLLDSLTVGHSQLILVILVSEQGHPCF
jgi:hypothetical protein